MELSNTLIVVKDIDRAVDFYGKILGLEVVLDFGANKTLTGGLVLQTFDTFRGFIDNRKVTFGGNNFELYFEEKDFDGFVNRLKNFDVEYVHPVKEHSWGQRVVRFYDLDKNVIEVGENMKAVCKRFYEKGLSKEEVASRMDVPVEYVLDCLKD